MTVAAIDRLVHHSTIFELNVESYRRKKATSDKQTRHDAAKAQRRRQPSEDSDIQGVPAKIMVDNLKSAVLQRLAGCAPVFNARYLDFSRHWGFDISACAPGRGNEKGRVENAVGYVKKNFLNGLELSEFSAINPAAQLWLDTVANVRIHGETRRRPIDLFQEEQPRLRPLNPMPYDIGRIETARASKQFRVTLDTNHYSVPARYVGVCVTSALLDRLLHHAETVIIEGKSFRAKDQIES